MPAGPSVPAAPSAPATLTKPAPFSPLTAAVSLAVTCPYADCGQSNPPGIETCLYCNRALFRRPPAGPLAPIAPGAAPGLLKLPAALQERYRIVSLLPAKGSEAELLIVEALVGGTRRVAKIYRHGIVPKREVQDRVARVDPQHHVKRFESGISDGYAFEVMEYCARGSLRDRLAAGPLTGDDLVAVVRELAAAIASVHVAGLVHRDLKPENVLVRVEHPLNLVLTDFSIASVLDGTQRFTSAARTLPYASPESLSGVIDGKSDYWALGMIVLEAALGKHPFAGLSEAVILHHLTTRSIDVSEIRERHLRKLLRGLLLRDPATRWGGDMIERWLSGDTSLVELRDEGPGAGFGEPYRIANEVCQTPEQLAVALSRNWPAGVADLGNGQLLAWFRNVQKDQNVVRLMIEMKFEQKLHVDMQLLKLILHLAPGIPPVWRGAPIDLPAILAHATRALNGDMDAAQWLGALYQFRVLEAYAEVGNQQAADLVRQWNAAGDRFEQTWKKNLSLIRHKAPARGPDDVVDWDALRYGQSEPTRPSLLTLHPKLLAMTYDPAWAERLRKRIMAELAGLIVHCPWITEIGDPLTMDFISLLVLEALLPDARTAVDRQTRADARRQEEEAEDYRVKMAAIAVAVASLKTAARHQIPTAEVCSELRDGLDHYAGLIADIRASGRSDLPWMEMRKAVIRGEPFAKRIHTLVDHLAETLAVNSGWMDWRVLVFMLLAVFVVPAIVGQSYFYMLGLIVAGVLAWRLLPNYFLLREIRDLAEKL